MNSKNILQTATNIPGTKLTPASYSFKNDGVWETGLEKETPFSTNKRDEYSFVGSAVDVTINSSGQVIVHAAAPVSNPQPNLTRNPDGTWPIRYIYGQ